MAITRPIDFQRAQSIFQAVAEFPPAERLCDAISKGYKNAEHMKKDKDLDPLRGLEDFKKLLAEVEAGKPTEID